MCLSYEMAKEVKPSSLNSGLITLELLLGPRRAGIQMPDLTATENFFPNKKLSNTNFWKKKKIPNE